MNNLTRGVRPKNTFMGDLFSLLFNFSMLNVFFTNYFNISFLLHTVVSYVKDLIF